MAYQLALAIVFFTLLILIRPFCVLLHELGHAVPIMLFTKGGATIFIGSYGDKISCFRIRIYKLDCWFRYDPFKFRGGICIPKAATISITQKFIYILCGPLASLLSAVLFFNTLYIFGINNVFNFITLFGVLFSIIDFIGNLIPFKMKLPNDKTLLSDGYQLLHLKKEVYPAKYVEGSQRFLKKDYCNAARLFEEVIENGYKNEDVYRLTYLSFLLCEDLDKAFIYIKKLESDYQLTYEDCHNYGYLGWFKKADIGQEFYFRKALQLNPENTASINALGYLLNENGQFKEALDLLKKAIAIDPQNAFAFNNLGHAKIETGLLKEGLSDIEHSITLDDQNAYAYRNLGIYHLKLNNIKEAKSFFLKAKQMDGNTERIDDLIHQVELAAKK